jgi:hypothetical protein
MRARKLEGSSADDGVRRRAKCCSGKKNDHVPRSSHEFFISAQAFLTYIFVPFALLPAPCVSCRAKDLFKRTCRSQTRKFSFFFLMSTAIAGVCRLSAQHATLFASRIEITSCHQFCDCACFYRSLYLSNIEENAAKI